MKASTISSAWLLILESQGLPVEWEWLEFKRGWNPEAVLHTLCAFANDFHNLDGGYIFLGIADDNGRPELPLTGQNRPYKAPVSLAKKNREFGYYIRKGSATVQAGHQEEIELIGLAAQVPFDGRVCHHAGLDDLQLPLIRDYLKEIASELTDQADRLDFVQLCRKMQIVDGPDEVVKPRNVGLLFFNEQPYRFFNYPFEALEEALGNAVYHRSYEIREPVELRILPFSQNQFD